MDLGGCGSSSDASSNLDEMEEASIEPNSEDTPEIREIKHSVVFKCVGIKEKYIENAPMQSVL